MENNKLKAEEFILKEHYTWQELVEIIAFLRSEQGCPWDRKQTHQSLRSHLIEEAYESIEAIDQNNPERLKDEIGDVLLQVLLHAQIASENQEFNISDVISHLSQKMISRHTHVFTKQKAGNAQEALLTWNQNKAIEKGQQSAAERVEDIPQSAPALSRAYKAQKRAAEAGFDWTDIEPVIAKIEEELQEVEIAAQNSSPLELEMELGDLLFAVVNYVRHLGLDPEIALNKATEKFQKRFRLVENKVIDQGKSMQDLNLEQLDEYWDQVKIEEDEML